MASDDNLLSLLERVDAALREVDGLARSVPARVGAGANPSTELDRELSDQLAERLQSILAVDLLTEEDPIDRATTDRLWIIDPLDGTLNAIVGCPDVSVSVALVESETLEGLVAAVSLPFYDKRHEAARDLGLFLNLKAATRRKVASARKLIGIGIPGEALEESSFFGSRITGLMRAGWTCRQSGSAALDLAWAGIGYWNAFWESAVSVWDVAAGELIAAEVGLEIMRRPTTAPNVARPHAIDFLCAERDAFQELADILL